MLAAHSQGRTAIWGAQTKHLGSSLSDMGLIQYHLDLASSIPGLIPSMVPSSPHGSKVGLRFGLA